MRFDICTFIVINFPMVSSVEPNARLTESRMIASLLYVRSVIIIYLSPDNKTKNLYRYLFLITIYWNK